MQATTDAYRVLTGEAPWHLSEQGGLSKLGSMLIRSVEGALWLEGMFVAQPLTHPRHELAPHTASFMLLGRRSEESAS